MRREGSAFEAVSDFTIDLANPFFFFTGMPNQPFAVAAHSDFHGLVTAADPATAGEILHFYATGLGAVSPSIPDATPAPANQLYTTLAPVSCGDPYSLIPNAPVLFAGLAAGYIGVYQVDVQVPLTEVGPTGYFRCTSLIPSAPDVYFSFWLK